MQLLVDGRVPDYLRVWMSGGELIGIDMVDAMDKIILLDEDARSIAMGYTWRKLIFKMIFLIDRAAIRDRLVPRQVAVGAKNGIDVMVDNIREWIFRNCHRPSYVLLQKDMKNVFNEILPSQFLRDCVERTPSSSRFTIIIVMPQPISFIEAWWSNHPVITRLPLDGTVVLLDTCSMGGGSQSQLPTTVAGV